MNQSKHWRCRIWKYKNVSCHVVQFLYGRCELVVEGKEERGFSPCSGVHLTNRYVVCVCVLLYYPFFSHTDLVPVVGPGSKDLVTTPIIGLRSLNNNTIQPLVYPHSLASCLSSRTIGRSEMKEFHRSATWEPEWFHRPAQWELVRRREGLVVPLD